MNAKKITLTKNKVFGQKKKNIYIYILDNEDDKDNEDKDNEDNNKENEEQGFKKVKKRGKKKYIPCVGISPGIGEKDDDDHIPPVSWAKTTFRKQHKDPKIEIPQSVIEQFPEIEYDDEIQEKFFDHLSEEGKKILEITEDLNSKIGFKPITDKMIEHERDIIRRMGEVDFKKDYNNVMIAATKNAVI